MPDPFASPRAPDDAAPAAAWSLPQLTALGEVLLCSSVPTQLGIGLALRLAGWSPTGPDGGLSLSYVVTLALADTVLLIGLMTWLIRRQGGSPARLWLGARRVVPEIRRGLLWVLPIFAAVVVLLNLIMALAPGLHNVAQNPLEQLAGTSGEAVLFGLVAVFAGGVREELQRAFLLDRFERHLGGAVAGVIVLSVAFGLGHLVQGWDAVVLTGGLGAFWAVAYLRRRSSIAPIVSHAGFNALEIVRAALLSS